MKMPLIWESVEIRNKDKSLDSVQINIAPAAIFIPNPEKPAPVINPDRNGVIRKVNPNGLVDCNEFTIFDRNIVMLEINPLEGIVFESCIQSENGMVEVIITAKF